MLNLTFNIPLLSIIKQLTDFNEISHHKTRNQFTAWDKQFLTKRLFNTCACPINSHPRGLSLGIAALRHSREPPADAAVSRELGLGQLCLAPYVYQGASWLTCVSSWIFSTTEKATKNILHSFLREMVSHKKTLCPQEFI